MGRTVGRPLTALGVDEVARNIATQGSSLTPSSVDAMSSSLYEDLAERYDRHNATNPWNEL